MFGERRLWAEGEQAESPKVGARLATKERKREKQNFKNLRSFFYSKATALVNFLDLAPSGWSWQPVIRGNLYGARFILTAAINRRHQVPLILLKHLNALN